MLVCFIPWKGKPVFCVNWPTAPSAVWIACEKISLNTCEKSACTHLWENQFEHMWENLPARICEKISLNTCEKICLHAFVRKSVWNMWENLPARICEKIKSHLVIKRQMSLTVVTHIHICPYLCIFSQIEFCICKSVCVCWKSSFFCKADCVYCKTLDLFDE